ncbi:MAG: plasmid recombination protein [Bacillota bacterium]
MVFALLLYQKQREYFMRAVRFIQEEVGEDNVFAATVHMDEKTPHMHICFTPITPDRKLSAKTVLGNQKKLSEWQTKFHEYMSSRWNELERGVSAIESHRMHVPVWLYKKAQRLDTQFQEVQQALSDITFLNAGKKRDEAITLLKKWIPEAERFTAQAKNTQGYINKLELDNLSLKGELRAKDEKINEAWDKAYQFKKVADRQQRLLDKVPKEVFERIEGVKAKTQERRR